MRLLIASTAAIALAGVASAQTLEITPGQWEYTTNMTMEMDMNGQKMPFPPQTETTSECVTAEDAVLDPADLQQEGCSVSNMSQSGSSMSFDMTCNQQGMTMTGDVDVQVADGGNSSTATINMNGSQPGVGTMAIAMTMTGNRTGACN